MDYKTHNNSNAIHAHHCPNPFVVDAILGVAHGIVAFPYVDEVVAKVRKSGLVGELSFVSLVDASKIQT